MPLTSAINDSDLILRTDGSIYHLGLHPEDIAENIITVGDPQRVSMISKYFDSIELSNENREFTAHTGMLNTKRITVLSTGMGSSNIEIVLNEIDLLLNVDFHTRLRKSDRRSANIIRLGTSGSVLPEIKCDTLILSEAAFALDGLGHFYPVSESRKTSSQENLTSAVFGNTGGLYYARCSQKLLELLDMNCPHLLSYTAPGFYAPQFRNTLHQNEHSHLIGPSLKPLIFRNENIGNIEMETAAIYYLSKYFNFQAISFSMILANRIHGTFSKNPTESIELMIKKLLHKISNNL